MRCFNRESAELYHKNHEHAREEWEAIHATLEPLPDLAELPVEVRKLVAEHLEANEVIDSMDGAERWWVLDDLLSVRLIDKDLLEKVNPIRRRFHMGGCGRSMVFGQRDGKWVFLGEGMWIS